MDKFLHRVKLYFGRHLHDVDDKMKINYLLLWATEEGQKRSKIHFQEGESKKHRK